MCYLSNVMMHCDWTAVDISKLRVIADIYICFSTKEVHLSFHYKIKFISSFFKTETVKGPVTLGVRPVAEQLRPKTLPTTKDHRRPVAPKNVAITLICGWQLV